MDCILSSRSFQHQQPSLRWSRSHNFTSQSDTTAFPISLYIMHYFGHGEGETQKPHQSRPSSNNRRLRSF